jgi:DNA-binding NarL/FixJ family response regulator
VSTSGGWTARGRVELKDRPSAPDRLASRRTPRALLVDPDRDYRTTLRTALTSAGIRVIAEAGSGTAAEALAREHLPDIVIMEVALEDGDGLQAARSIRAWDPDIQVILLTRCEDGDIPFASPGRGLYVAAFVWKSDGIDRLVEAVHRAYAPA